MWADFTLFTAVGLLAQIVDGALGMAYGVVSTTVLLSFGVAPANASASVHTAELFTTAASAASHLWHRNVNWRLFWRLAPTGIIGGVAGAYLLTALNGAVVKPFIVAYMAVMGVVILWRASRRIRSANDEPKFVPALGLIGGFVDAAGGGGWGPVVTSSLVADGGTPRFIIGTVNTAEFFLTAAVSAAFIGALLTGHWQSAGDVTNTSAAVAGLILGGLMAAPIAGYAVKRISPRRLGLAVGALVLLLVVYQVVRLSGLI